jgi:KaiC/GvpD/RAD55 family RecA-like ATPase
MIQNNQNLIAVVGLSGMGKTVLISQCINIIKHDFDYIIWYDLQHFSSFDILMTDLLELLLEQELTKIDRKEQIKVNSHNSWQKQVIQYFKKYRCLVVIDSFQLAFEKAQLSGTYQRKYQDFSSFFKLIRVC